MSPKVKVILTALIYTISLVLSAPVNKINTEIERNQYKLAISAYIANEIDGCTHQIPNGQGLLVHINSNIPQQFDESDQSKKLENKFQKRFIPKMANAWKELPMDQKLSVFGTGSGLFSVVAFGTNAAQTYDSEQISNIKSKAAEHEVKKELSGKNGKKKSIGKGKHSTSHPILPPPPPPLITHAKRSILYRIELKKRGIGSEEKAIETNLRGSAASFTKKIASHHSPPHSSHYSSAHSNFPINKQRSHSSGRNSIHTHNFEEKKKIPDDEKKPNKTLGKVLQWTNASVNLIYIPIALMTLHKVQRVQDDDTHSYKKRNVFSSTKPSNSSNVQLIPKEFLPIVNCIPISSVGEQDFVIPKGAL